jgi:hypothetical protein
VRRLLRCERLPKPNTGLRRQGLGVSADAVASGSGIAKVSALAAVMSIFAISSILIEGRSQWEDQYYEPEERAALEADQPTRSPLGAIAARYL